MNLTNYRRRSGYGQRKKWSERAVVAKARKRMEPVDLPDEPKYIAPKLPKLKTATVSIRIGRESISFQVFRFDATRLFCRGKAQAASTIGKRIALILDSQL